MDNLKSVVTIKIENIDEMQKKTERLGFLLNEVQQLREEINEFELVVNVIPDSFGKLPPIDEPNEERTCVGRSDFDLNDDGERR